MKRISKLKIVQDDKKPIGTEILAAGIMQISKSIKEINETRLTRKALVVLIAHTTRLRQQEVSAVLDALESMEATWLKKASK